MKLKGKNIILTGGTTGIGREMVKLLKDDNRLLVIASNKNRLDSLSSEFNGISTRQVDLASIEEINDASKYILREHENCLLYTSPSPRDMRRSRMPSSA